MHDAAIKALVNEQAADEGLWFQAETCAEAYVQAELRRLHAVIEGRSPTQCAVGILERNLDPEERLELIALIANDKAWDAILKVGEVLLDKYYPEDVFTGESGDPGPVYVAALRNALRNVK